MTAEDVETNEKLKEAKLEKDSRVQLEIGASAVDAQKCTLKGVTRCAA
jgi:hypothetical protein